MFVINYAEPVLSALFFSICVLCQQKSSFQLCAKFICTIFRVLSCSNDCVLHHCQLLMTQWTDDVSHKLCNAQPLLNGHIESCIWSSNTFTTSRHFYNTVGIELPDVTSRLSGKTPLDGVQAYVVQDTMTFSP